MKQDDIETYAKKHGIDKKKHDEELKKGDKKGD